jgi:predicted DNA-binding transcriptional regulator AlpA
MQALIPEARFYLSPDEVSILTGISKSQLEVWRRRGDGPKFIRIGKLVKYRRDLLEAFLEGREDAA